MGKFLYSKDNRVIVYLCQSKGETFRGVAKCGNDDAPNKEIGERLAQCRADMKIRKRDLAQIRLAKEAIYQTIHTLPQTQSKLWMQWYQDACRVEHQQHEHMRNLKDQIKNLSNGIIL